MHSDHWLERRELIHEHFYDLLLSRIGCGAFDGGCVIVATALAQVIGGEVHVLVRDHDAADHAVVFKGGLLWDYDGPAEPDAFIDRFNHNELAAVKGHRPIRKTDLPNAPRDPLLVHDLIPLFDEMLTPITGSNLTP